MEGCGWRAVVNLGNASRAAGYVRLIVHEADSHLPRGGPQARADDGGAPSEETRSTSAGRWPCSPPQRGVCPGSSSRPTRLPTSVMGATKRLADGPSPPQRPPIGPTLPSAGNVLGSAAASCRSFSPSSRGELITITHPEMTVLHGDGGGCGHPRRARSAAWRPVRPVSGERPSPPGASSGHGVTRPRHPVHRSATREKLPSSCSTRPRSSRTQASTRSRAAVLCRLRRPEAIGLAAHGSGHADRDHAGANGLGQTGSGGAMRQVAAVAAVLAGVMAFPVEAQASTVALWHMNETSGASAASIA